MNTALLHARDRAAFATCRTIYGCHQEMVYANPGGWTDRRATIYDELMPGFPQRTDFESSKSWLRLTVFNAY